ncbi:hypothetical protein [Bartonella queenslandensis]|nr:hypothetical protein [Bartonella queenslandensis]
MILGGMCRKERLHFQIRFVFSTFLHIGWYLKIADFLKSKAGGLHNQA